MTPVEAGAVRKVICWRQLPFPLLAKPREIIRMVIVVSRENVETHEPEQLLCFGATSGEEIRDLEQTLVIKNRLAMRNFDDSRGGKHMHPPAIAYVEPLRRKVSSTKLGREQLEFRHFDSAFRSTGHVIVFERARFKRVHSRRKLHKPSAILIFDIRLRPCTTR